ncbi:hypothetical protein PCK2_000314 [Pneumocystis canis]|nr:hypothetical protein PCK2_000314 [Pneumocystis canis]
MKEKAIPFVSDKDLLFEKTAVSTFFSAMEIPFNTFFDLSYQDLRERFYRLQCLEKQRRKLSLLPSSPWSISDSQETRNCSRNRYYDIVPYNKYRVKLVDQENDYINASYIFLPNGQRYIAAQGPLKSTVSHFWSMIWHELDDHGIVLMLTKIEEQGVEKCVKYWPEEEQKELIIQKISLKVEFIKKNYEEKSETIIHHLKLSKFKGNTLESEKYIYHVYFRNWPDHGVPRDFPPIINLIYLITNIKRKKEDIVLVHCSAGCGRTGTKSDKTVEENLLHALYENGISSISLFETYIKDGIDRYSNKLNDIQRRLQMYLTEMIKPTLTYFDEEKFENSDSLIHGDFAEKIGEDFFGFKELGLDKELGLSSLLVPFHLLQGRTQQGLKI